MKILLSLLSSLFLLLLPLSCSSAEQTKIPLTIGFANLSGDDLSAMVAEDAAALSPLFARSKIVPAHQIPSAAILFVYANLNEDGTIKGSVRTGRSQESSATRF